MPWTDTRCCKMAEGSGPNFASCAPAVPAYADAPLSADITVEAYIGYPLPGRNGELLGTMCAIDPNPQPPTIRDRMADVYAVAQALALLISQELDLYHGRLEDIARAWRAGSEIPGPERWRALIETEERNCQPLGSPLCCVHVHLGEPLHEDVARLVREVCGEASIIAAPSAQTIAALSAEVTSDHAQTLGERLNGALRPHFSSAKVGVAVRHPSQLLRETYQPAVAAA